MYGEIKVLFPIQRHESRGPCWANGRGDQTVVWFSSLLGDYNGPESICQYNRFAEGRAYFLTFFKPGIGRCPPRCYCQSSEGCSSIFSVQWSRKAEKNQAKIGVNNAPKVPRPAETAFHPVAEDLVAYTGEDTQIFKVFGVISPEKLVLDDLWSIWPVRLRPRHLGAPPTSVDQFRRRKRTDRYQLYICHAFSLTLSSLERFCTHFFE